MNTQSNTIGYATSQISVKKLFELYETTNFKSSFYDVFGLPFEFVCDGISQDKFIYNILCENYRNDFFVRYSFYEKVLSKKTATSFFEFPILDSRIDVVSVNGKSIAYEIKTEYDTLKRLSKQINDYSNAFEYVYVICSSNMFDDVERIIPDYCGIYVYSGKNRIVYSQYKEATISPNLNVKCMLGLMLKKERTKYFKNSDIDFICSNYDFVSINSAFKKSLKLRFKDKNKEIEYKCSLFK